MNKILTVVYGGGGAASANEIDRRIAAGEWPRVRLYEKTLGSDMLDEAAVRTANGVSGAVLRRLPMGVSQALLAYGARDRYDAIVSWGERFGLTLAALLKGSRASIPHVALFSWISTPRKAAVLRRVHTHIHRLVLWSSVQYAFARDVVGVPTERLVQLRWLVDQEYWRPVSGPTDMICGVGREMRDYPTLIEALRTLPIRCHIAAKIDPGKRDAWMRDIPDPSALPAHISFGSKPFPELRQLYARSRFVVLPLYPTDTDNGVTAMTEAMAMGKAVICSQVDGQRDVLEHGVSGLFVPPRDPAALREAIEHLWNNPEECERMGLAGRRHIERHHTLEQFVSGVRDATTAAINEAGARRRR